MAPGETTTGRASGGPTSPFAGAAAAAAPRHWFAVAEWCEPSPWVLAYACEQYISAPIWCSMIVGDVIGLWLIVAMLLRHREQATEWKRRRLALPRATRVRRDWRTLLAASRLTTLATGKEGMRRGEWVKSWQRVARARVDRKEYMKKVEYNLFGVLSRAAGPLLVLFVSCLVLFETHAFYTLGLPWLGLTGPVGQAFGYCMGAIPVRIFLDYARTCLTDPGRPRAEADSFDSQSQDADVELAVRAQDSRRCHRCEGAKPPRCHHCKVCRRCVLKMDHHCPFVNNCVGLRNHRYFCFFLLDIFLGSLVVCFALAPQLLEVAWPGRYKAKLSLPHRLHVASAFLLAFMAQSLTGPFLVFHVQLILLNETTIEFMGRRSRRRGKAVAESYSKGPLENFSEACGAPPPCCQRQLGKALEYFMPQNVARLAKRSA